MKRPNDVAATFMMADEMWEKIKVWIPPPEAKPKGGRPRNDDRQMMNAIYYVARTGVQWKALPRCLGAASRVHDRLTEWRRAGVFLNIWKAGLEEFEALVGIDWEWQMMDGAITKAPLGGEASGKSPVDRSKIGVKRSVLTEGHGIPLSVTIDGANRHDMKMTTRTLDALIKEPPESTVYRPKNLCLDNAFDCEEVRQALAARGYIAHIRTRGEEIVDKKNIPKYRAKRWVVERTHSWMNRFRRVLIRWEGGKLFGYT